MPTRNAEIIAANLVGFTTCKACIATWVVVEIVLARAFPIQRWNLANSLQAGPQLAGCNESIAVGAAIRLYPVLRVEHRVEPRADLG